MVIDPQRLILDLHRFVLISRNHHTPEVILAALDALESIATTLQAVPAQIAAAEAAAVLTAEANLEPAITSIQTAVAAIVAALPAPTA